MNVLLMSAGMKDLYGKLTIVRRRTGWYSLILISPFCISKPNPIYRLDILSRKVKQQLFDDGV